MVHRVGFSMGLEKASCEVWRGGEGVNLTISLRTLRPGFRLGPIATVTENLKAALRRREAMLEKARLIVILRIVCRACFSRGRYGRLGLDDLITFVCLIILIISSAFASIGISYGLGRREKTLDEYNLQQAIKWNAIINCVLIWSFSLPKFAIIAILKRILDYGTKTTILFWGLALTCQSCFLATSIWWFAQCTPAAYQWDKSIEGGRCASNDVLTRLAFATSAYSAFLDLFFALYPVPFIMKLNMPLRNRLAVCFALGLSAMACAVSVYKLAVFQDAFEMMAEDRTYSVPYLDIFGVAEGALLIIGASLPTLGPLFRLVKCKVTTYASGQSASHQSGDRSQNNPGVHGNSSSNWLHKRGNTTFDDEENVSTTGMHSSVDDIPLVSTAKPVARYREDPFKDEMSVDKPAGY
ncbi:integral membrane [Trichoderma arundinaceum]|uniref:Integral membrane n=1 Tax=Trichoderma arundinaceum TaxID=490622 RepID=A0A395P0X2_TRIAR|nr:integral membrane [Trichoderma arundinaceum]